MLTSLELDEVDARWGDVTQDVHDLPLEVINLDHRRVPLPTNNTRTADSCRKEARHLRELDYILTPDNAGAIEGLTMKCEYKRSVMQESQATRTFAK